LNLKADAPVDLGRQSRDNFNKMKSVPLNAFPRSLGRRAGVKKLRASGRIPAVIYGAKSKTQNIEVNAREIGDLIHRRFPRIPDLSLQDDTGSGSRWCRKSSITPSGHKPRDFPRGGRERKGNGWFQWTVGEAAGARLAAGPRTRVKRKARCPRPSGKIVMTSAIRTRVDSPAKSKPPGRKSSAIRMPCGGGMVAAHGRGKLRKRGVARRRATGDDQRKKEEGEEGAAPREGRGEGREKGGRREKAPKVRRGGAAAVPEKVRQEGRKRPRRRNNPAQHRSVGSSRAWRTFISSWVWATWVRTTRERDTTPDFCRTAAGRWKAADAKKFNTRLARVDEAEAWVRAATS
jgi:hypothetical protein